MHWRKPFPPRSVRPSAIAELRELIAAAFHGEAGRLPEAKPGEADKTEAAVHSDRQPNPESEPRRSRLPA